MFQFECEDGEADTVYEISEAQTCVYTLIIHTGRLCKHPYLKKAAPAKPVPITCNPLVSAEQYQEYLNTLQGEALWTFGVYLKVLKLAIYNLSKQMEIYFSSSVEGSNIYR